MTQIEEIIEKIYKRWNNRLYRRKLKTTSGTIVGYRHGAEIGKFGTFYMQKPYPMSILERKRELIFENALLVPQTELPGQETLLLMLYKIDSPEWKHHITDPDDSGLMRADEMIMKLAIEHGWDCIIYGEEEIVDYRHLMK